MAEQYIVGFDIVDARNLVTQDGNPCDPFVVVTCCGRRVETKTKEEKLSQVLWNESHKWADLELTEDSGHVLANRAVPLRREDAARATGVLNLTVFCLRPGESVPSWSAEEVPDEHDERELADISRAVLGAQDAVAEAEGGSPFHLLVSVFRVEGLAKIFGSYPNPFVTVEFAGTVVKTPSAWEVEHWTWNACARFPVVPPIYEDTVVLKLWSAGSGLAADLLLAQGFLSFSELRSSAMAARWFNLYGWSPEEVPDAAGLRGSGEGLKANFFIGRLLVGARVAPVEAVDELQPAGLDPSRATAAIEPAVDSAVLFVDVYEVAGAVGRECRVEVQFGRHISSTPEWVTPTEGPRTSNNDAERDAHPHELEDLTTFAFAEVEGRMEPLLAMCPTDPESQPDVMINVYTRGVLSGDRRIAYARLRMSDFQELQLVPDGKGNLVHAPARPRYVPLLPVPGAKSQRVAPSVLIVLEQHGTDNIRRAPRRVVQPTVYCLRAYIFMARNVHSGPNANCAVRVSCAGISKSTRPQQGVRPTWMTPVDLKVTLQSDRKLHGGAPSMEPIQLTLVDQGGRALGAQDADLGQAVCQYEHVRQTRGASGEWEPYRLDPQWINLYGGTFGSRVVGQVLVTFELLEWKHLGDPGLRPAPMWPQPLPPRHAGLSGSVPTDGAPLCRLRKATLHFALHGLRDLVMQTGALPEVVVRVKSFEQGDHEGEEEEKVGSAPGRFYTLRFRRRPAVGAGDRRSQLLEWKSDALGSTDCGNFEMLEVQRMRVMVPDSAVFEPCVSVEVREQPSAGLFGRLTQGPLIGEHRCSLSKMLPCFWYDGVTLDQPFHKQEARVRSALAATEVQVRSQESFQQRSLQLGRSASSDPAASCPAPTPRSGEAAGTAGGAEVGSNGLPAQLRKRRGKNKAPELVKDPVELNMRRGRGFGAKRGLEAQAGSQEGGHPVVSGCLERANQEGGKSWASDFAFQNRPLLRGRDALSSEESEGTDWNFEHGRCFGFVKYEMKLTDGWDEGDSDGERTSAYALEDETPFSRATTASAWGVPGGFLARPPATPGARPPGAASASFFSKAAASNVSQSAASNSGSSGSFLSKARVHQQESVAAPLQSETMREHCFKLYCIV
ncbi:unnamed protein product [Prorocentrum cordatum]|uniref:C2 domain-containing protein n=1 Tax=Prorocentrum cordatum TaxID=2364126 RepID=A0ABN9Q3B9_9DINO|nr:unnamed protein product [Polarella glacialis]